MDCRVIDGFKYSLVKMFEDIGDQRRPFIGIFYFN